MKEVRASIITIGDELLIGQTLDTNSAWMGRRLTEAGISLVRRLAVGDVEREVLEALEEESEKADIILITGGLGPTEDDKTKDILCKYFKSRLILNETVLKMVRERLSRVGVEMLETNRAQALVPDNCTPLLNKKGTAPGLWFEKGGKVFVAMPGIPYEMKGLMEAEVMPRLQEFFEHPVILYNTILTTGIAESALAKKIEKFEHALPGNVGLAYLPGNGLLKLRLTAKGEIRSETQEGLNILTATLKKEVGAYMVADRDVPLALLVGNVLREKGWTISTAESCTGGYISHLLTSIAGSSSYYAGSMITYSNEIKNKLLEVPEEMLREKGAVSEEVVREMAKSVRKKLETSVGIAVSGIMGPGGGTETKPVGTVWIAVSWEGQMRTRKLLLRYDRAKNIEMTASYAFLLFLSSIRDENVVSQ